MEIVGVPDELRDDLPESERHDREVVAAQAQGRQPDEDPCKRGRSAGDEEDEPDRDVNSRSSRETPAEPKWKFTCWKWPDANQPATYAPTA